MLISTDSASNLQDVFNKELNNKSIAIKDVNSSFYAAYTTNNILKAKASNEVQWINKVNEISKGNFAIIEWMPEEVKGEKLKDLIN